MRGADVSGVLRYDLRLTVAATLAAVAVCAAPLLTTTPAAAARPPHASKGGSASASATPTTATASATPTPTPSQSAATGPAPALDRTVVTTSRLPVVRSEAGLDLDLCSNGGLTPDPAVRTVVLVVHGDERNACGAVRSVVESAELAGRVAETLVVAPHFLTESDVAADPTAATRALYWSSSGWKSGALSLSAPYTRPWAITSYDVVDLLSRLVTDGRFANLASVVVAGHSAGGQLVNRYDAGTSLVSGQPAGVTRRYVVANPSSYLYWDSTRKLGGTWRPLTSVEVSACPGFNTFKYGLSKRTGYLSGIDDATLRTRFASATVEYLLGAADIDPADSSLDTGCAAEHQGATRLERGQRYAEHLARAFGPDVLTRHRTTVVPGVGHSAHDVYTSPAGQYALFRA